MFKKVVSILIVITVMFTLCSCEAVSSVFGGLQGEDRETAGADAVAELPDGQFAADGEDAWLETVSANTVVQKEGVTTAFIKEWHEGYTVYAAYPIVEGMDALSEELNGFVLDKIDSYEGSLKSGDAYDGESDKPELTVIYEPFSYGDTSLSFKFVTYSDNGSKRVVNKIETLNYDRLSGEKIVLSDLFKEDADYLSAVADAVNGQLSENEILSQFGGVKGGSIAADEKNFSDFVIDEGKLRFFFNAGTIAPEEAGSFEADVLLADLEGVKSNVLKGKSAINAAAVVVLPDSLKSGENDMEAFSIDGIDPMNDKVIALTFDDGPYPPTTQIVLDALASVGGKATFFMVGQNAKEYPDMVKKVYDAGMEIGNHSYSHPDFNQMDYDGMAEQLEKTNDVIQEATGKRPILFRAPYGNVSAEAAEKYGRISVYWTVDTLDWKNRDVQMNHDNTVGEAYDGALVLMHDIHQETADSIKSIVTDLTDKGYKLVTVSQLIQVMIARGQDPTWRLGRDSSTARPSDSEE